MLTSFPPSPRIWRITYINAHVLKLFPLKKVFWTPDENLARDLMIAGEMSKPLSYRLRWQCCQVSRCSTLCCHLCHHAMSYPVPFYPRCHVMSCYIMLAIYVILFDVEVNKTLLTNRASALFCVCLDEFHNFCFLLRGTTATYDSWTTAREFHEFLFVVP